MPDENPVRSDALWPSLEGLVDAILTFRAGTALHLDCGEGELLLALAGSLDQVHGWARSAPPDLDLPGVSVHDLAGPLDPIPAGTDLLITTGFLDGLSLVEIQEVLPRLDAATPQALHLVACHRRTPRQSVVLSPDDWARLFAAQNPDHRLASVHDLDGDPARPVAVFIKGHPAFRTADLPGLLAETERLAECGFLLAAEALVRARLDQERPEERLFLDVVLGNLLTARGFLPEAEALFTELVRRHPDSPLGYINLAGVYLRAGRADLALPHAREAARRFPDDPEVAGLLQWLPEMENAPGRPRIGIISGYYPGLRFNSQVNHKAYADLHGYWYIFNSSPERDPRSYFRKIETLIRYLDLFDWVFWIDDDAYFTRFDTPLDAFIAEAGPSDLVICRSPSTKKLFTKFSAGQFLLRNTPRAHAFLRALLEVDLSRVRAFWREDLGYYSEGDQDAMVYLSETDPRFSGDFIRILDHQAFNNRDFEFQARLDEHFLVHFTGQAKVASKAAFCQRLGVNPYLVPEGLLAPFRTEAYDHLG